MEKKTENRPVAIRISGVKKMYRLGQIGGGTLTADLQSWWARIRGKEDPNTMVGTEQRLKGQSFMALNNSWGLHLLACSMYLFRNSALPSNRVVVASSLFTSKSLK